jgi:hypothetical protein
VQLTAIRQSDNHGITIRGGLGNAAGDHSYNWLIHPSHRDYPGQYRIELRSNSGARALGPVFELTTVDDGSSPPQQDLILSLDPSSIEVTHLIGRGDIAHDLFRMHVTLRMMNASRTPSGAPQPRILEVKCNWRQQHDENGTWNTIEPSGGPMSEFWGEQPFWVGPIRSGEWTTQRITIDFKVFRSLSSTPVRLRIKLELDPDHEINDPQRSNNTTFSREYTLPERD